MGFLAKLFSRGEPVETRAGAWGSLPVYSLGGSAGAASVQMAEGLAAVQSCVQAIASGIAALPARVYQQTPAGRIEASGHPVSRLIRRPNDRQTWPDWIEMTLGDVLLHGNALSEVVTDGRGAPVALNPIPWRHVQTIVLPSGRLAYDIVAFASPMTSSHSPRRLLADEVFHLRDRSDDGWIGRSRISRSAGVIQSAHSLATFAQSVWDNSAQPSGLVTFTPATTKEGRERQRAYFEARSTGTHNAGKLMFAEGDTKFSPFQITPEDAQCLASRQFSVTEICRLFGVPPPIVQDYSHNTFTNAAQAELWFASRTLLPWAAKIEAEFARSVFSDPSFSLDIDLSGLLRGDYGTLLATNTAAVVAGLLTRDEAREAAGYGPLSADDGSAPAGEGA